MMSLSQTTLRDSARSRLRRSSVSIDKIPSFEEDPSYYIDTGDTKEFQLKTGVGECAGALVELVSFILEEADRLIYEAGIDLERDQYVDSAEHAFEAMIKAADALLTTEGQQHIDNETTVREFRSRFFEPGIVFPGFGAHIFKAAEEDTSTFDRELTHRRVEEATLFVEEAHNVYGRMRIRQEEESSTKKREARPARIPKAPRKRSLLRRSLTVLTSKVWRVRLITCKPKFAWRLWTLVSCSKSRLTMANRLKTSQEPHE